MKEYFVTVNGSGDTRWHKANDHKCLHRENGPAVEWANGSKKWYLNGKLHRENGPAIEYTDGSKKWYLNGKLHRENSPAIEYADGSKKWYLNGERHRENGPACEHADGSKSWYLNGERLSEEEHRKAMQPKPSCANKIVEIEGVKYRLVEASG